jgi:hypothetical protein
MKSPLSTPLPFLIRRVYTTCLTGAAAAFDAVAVCPHDRDRTVPCRPPPPLALAKSTDLKLTAAGTKAWAVPGKMHAPCLHCTPPLSIRSPHARYRLAITLQHAVHSNAPRMSSNGISCSSLVSMRFTLVAGIHVWHLFDLGFRRMKPPKTTCGLVVLFRSHAILPPNHRLEGNPWPSRSDRGPHKRPMP